MKCLVLLREGHEVGVDHLAFFVRVDEQEYEVYELDAKFFQE